MRKHGRIDANQTPLVAYAKGFGASWLSMASLGNGAPDGLLGLHKHTFLVEFKTDKGSLTDDQHTFIQQWRGSPVHILRTLDDVDRLLRSVVPNKRKPKKIAVDRLSG